jgi:1-acyl-sn-glycerol-3-phosphate acyltransferase
MTAPRPGSLNPMARALMRPSTKWVFPTEVVGLEHIPRSGGAILAPNHVSFLDSAVLIGVLRRRVIFVGKAEYLDSWKTRHLFPAIGMIPIDRSNGTASALALDAAVDVIDRGDLFGIFPEGTRSRDGMLHKGRTGVARLALRTGVPVIPVGISGTDLIQPPGASLPRPFRRCRVRFGPPLDMTPYTERRGAAVYRALTDALMYEIRELSGQTYVHRYAERPTAAAEPSGAEATIAEAPDTPAAGSPRPARLVWARRLPLPTSLAGWSRRPPTMRATAGQDPSLKD